MAEVGGPRGAELEAIYQSGFVGTVLFVDDNLVANQKAVREMLEEIVVWQKARGYPYPLTGEASINLARNHEVLRLMQEARFTHMFVGVESPDPATLQRISKRQNTMDPLVQSLRVLESYGLEPILGMIMGFDTDGPDSGRALARFIAETHAPIVYFNLLAALPKTPLWTRMETEERLLPDEHGDAARSEALLSCATTNVRFKLPNDVVLAQLRQVVREVYSAREVFRRFEWIVEHVHSRQKKGRPPHEARAQQWYLAKFGATALWRVLRRLGGSEELRGELVRFVSRLFELKRRGVVDSVVEELLLVAPNAFHLVTWGRTLLADEAGRAAEARAAQWRPVPVAPAGPPAGAAEAPRLQASS